MNLVICGHPLGVCCKKGSEWIAFLAALAGRGFAHVELTVADVEPGSCVFDRSYLARSRAAIGEQGLRVSVHAPGGTNLGEKVRRIRQVSLDMVREAVEVAEALGGEWVTVHAGAAGLGNGPLEHKRPRLDIVVDSLQRIVDATAGCGVKLAVENLPRLPVGQALCRLADSAEELRYVVTAVDSPRVGALVDIGHARIHSADDAWTREFIATVEPWVLGYHLHWNDRRDDLHRPLAADDGAELAGYLAAVARTSPRAPILLECYSLAENLASLDTLVRLGLTG